MAVSLFQSLESFVAELRGQFDGLENDAKNLMENVQQVYVSERYGTEDSGVKLMILLNLMQIIKVHKNSV